MIKLKNVFVRKGGKNILKGISWTTRPGEHWFVMGPNGSGKTTLMELLAGYVWPQKGEVEVLGEKPDHFGAAGALRDGGLAGALVGLGYVIGKIS